jgi:hypothetical protein
MNIFVSYSNESIEREMALYIEDLHNILDILENVEKKIEIDKTERQITTDIRKRIVIKNGDRIIYESDLGDKQKITEEIQKIIN